MPEGEQGLQQRCSVDFDWRQGFLRTEKLTPMTLFREQNKRLAPQANECRSGPLGGADSDQIGTESTPKGALFV
jgi:hypothetical protein